MTGFQPFAIHQRARWARWILAGAFLVLAGAFFRTQILQYDRYRLRAQNNRLRAVPLEPARGTIYDWRGEVIAETVPGYEVALLASSLDSLRQVLARFARIVPLDSAEADRVEARYLEARYQPATVLGNATREQVARLEEHRISLPGLVIQTEPRRIYPHGRQVAHVVGYVGEVTQEDMDRYPSARLGSIIGRSGLEREYDDSLRGSPGVRYIEVDALGRLVREQGAAPVLPSIPGQAIRTTIDLPLQLFVDSIWPRNQSGALIAMTPRGEIRALYSTPAFDPNDFIGGISAREWQALNTDPTLPLLNRAIQVRYPPGSPFKLATAAMALRRGLIDFSSHMPLPCRGGIQFGNRYFKCWDKGGHGSLDLTAAIAQSCDVYFYQLGMRLQLDPLLHDGTSMGFHDRAGIDLVNEVLPIYPTSTAYYDERYGPHGWSAGAVLNLAIGQGENTQTLINMMKFYAALAGDGRTAAPFLVRPDSSSVVDLGLTPAQLDGLRQALIQVVEHGTAARSRVKELTVAGKTGTAQNPRGKDHGWFIGFAPAQAPEIVVGAIFEFGGHGTAVAPYVVRAMQRYLLGPDSGPPVPIRVETVEDTAPRAVDLSPGRTVPAPPDTGPAPPRP
jgi:penicillin-binding protein 2